MKKSILIIVVVVLVAAIAYFLYQAQNQAPAAGDNAGEPKVYTTEEKKNILEKLAADTASTSVPTVDEQKKILEALANQSQPSSTSTKAQSGTTTSSQQELSDEEKMKILKALAQ